ncbi:MAG TPA: NUDIX hydrolase YfcD [Desulfobulbaceae bacterium]|nr:NUDIX hydrolase YfcD [Desulfobulbaceae bacterium]
MAFSPEFVQIVDENNEEIAGLSRRMMREQNLIHRASYVLVFNSRDELFVQQRSLGKDIYPGSFDIAAGGVVKAGESYEESAERELAEEFGVHGVSLLPCFDHYFEDENNRVWGRVFRCRHDGPFILQPEEVTGGRFMTLDRIMALSREQPFTPDGIDILRRLMDKRD